MSFADLQLDDLNDVTEINDAFSTLPIGQYSFELSAKLGENDKDAKKKDGTPRTQQRLELKYKVLDVVSIEDGVPEPKLGTVHTEFADLDKEGLRFMKIKLQAIGEKMGTSELKSILIALEGGIVVNGAVTHRKYKDKDNIERVNASVSDTGFEVMM